jgi:hypothetical protein
MDRTKPRRRKKGEGRIRRERKHCNTLVVNLACALALHEYEHVQSISYNAS